MKKVDDEISLYEVIEVISKRWKFIVFSTLFVTFLVYMGGIVKIKQETKVNLASKKYETYVLLKVGEANEEPLESTASLENIVKINLKNINLTESEIGLSNISFVNIPDFMKVTVQSYSPESSKNIIKKVAKFILKRHQKLFVDAKANIRNSALNAKDLFGNIATVQLDLVQFSVQPTKLEVLSENPVEVVEYVKAKKTFRKIIPMVFIIMLIITILISFYREGKKAVKRK